MRSGWSTMPTSQSQSLNSPDTLGSHEFQPSGLELHPVSGNYFVVAARQRAIAEVEPTGRVLSARAVSAPWHRQMEGITFADDNTLIIADEGRGRKGRLTLYPAAAGRNRRE